MKLRNRFLRLLSVFLSVLLLSAIFAGCDLSSTPGGSNSGGGGRVASLDAFDAVLPTPESLGLTENTLKNHHYNALSAEEQILYVAVLDSWNRGDETLNIKNVDYDALTVSLKRTVAAVYFDHPECYRYANAYHLKGTLYPGENDDSAVIGWSPTLFCETRSEEEANLDAALSAILSSASALPDEYSRVKLVHDHLVNTVTYDHAALNDLDSLGPRRNSAYSALIEKAAVCGGYARAFQLLLNRLGIPCTTISGTSEGMPHAWNLALLDGEYYLFDPTWDDAGEQLSYHYFAATTAELQKTHTFTQDFTYPTCTATACNYYVKEGFLMERYDFDDAARIVSAQKGNEAAHLKFLSKAEYDSAVKDLVKNQKWATLPEFEGQTSIRYVGNEKYFILTLYFPSAS